MGDREYMRNYMRNYWKTHPEQYAKQKRNATLWNKTHPEKNREKCLRLRREILTLLGNKCSNPFNIDHSAFENEIDYFYCLQIDHVNGGGYKEIKSFSSWRNYYKNIIKQIKNGSKDYQILCANCNWIKRHKNKCEH